MGNSVESVKIGGENAYISQAAAVGNLSKNLIICKYFIIYQYVIYKTAYACVFAGGCGKFCLLRENLKTAIFR